MNDLHKSNLNNDMNNGRLIDGNYDRLTGLLSMNHFFETAIARREELQKACLLSN